MLNPEEREALIDLIVNVDEVIADLTPEQRKRAEKNQAKIYGNYHALLGGIGGENEKVSADELDGRPER